jgi:POT family proton-dependent oligopeptide transporter
VVYGYTPALVLPAVLMAISFVLFVAGRRHYPAEPPRRAPTTAERTAARSSIRTLAPLFGLIAVFWFVYDQTASTWIFFARDFADLGLWGSFSITPDQIQAANPIFILVLTPIYNRLWSWLEVRRGTAVPDTRKMRYGFWIVVLAMAGMAVAGMSAAGGKVSAWWLLLATFVITLAELCISVVGLELAFRRAAPGTRSAVTGAFLATTFVGDLFGGMFAQLYGRVSPGVYFLLQAGIAAAAALAFGWIAKRDEHRRVPAAAPEAADTRQPRDAA